MYPKIKLTVLGIIFSLGLIAQGKIYIVPYLGFYTGAYKGVDTVNNKQNFIKTKPFLGKDFTIGIKLNYYKNRLGITAGVGAAFYSTGFYRKEDKSNPLRVDSRSTISEGPWISYFAETRYSLLDFNIKMPKWLSKNPEKPYLLVSNIAPFLGFEYRKVGKNFENDFRSGAEIATSQGNIPGTVYYHAYKNTHTSMRAGIDWVFFNEAKRRFILTFMYQFAFKDAGYYRYHFSKPSRGIDFYYQTTTRGNGFSIKAGVPIKIFENRKRPKSAL